MDRHAYLILAHNSLENLKYAIESIDDERNDIFIHLDKKWKEVDEETVLQAVGYTKSKIFFTPRLDITWGGYSQIKGELLLMREAVSRAERYAYYHLMSGQDMAIKTQYKIHKFFDENQGKEFLAFCGDDFNKNNYYKLKYYHIERGRNKFLQVLNKVFVTLQKFFRVDRLKKLDMRIVGGSNWASMTYDFVSYLLDNTDLIYKIFKNTFCADEFYKHTLAYNSSFKDKIFLLKISDDNNDATAYMQKANQRQIDWVRGNPYTFGVGDIEELLNSNCLFARKFDYEKDKQVQKMLLSNIKIENKT